LSKTHLYVTDSHAHFQHDNHRATLLGKLINDVKPDVVIHGGDSADMPSLSSYDKGRKSFHGRTYRADLDAHLDWSDRLFHELRKQKKKLPKFVFLEGNHEHRIKRAVNFQSELDGTIGIEDLELDRYYDEIVEYNGATPGVVNIDGINYAHYFVSGVMGRPIGGEHPAYSLVAKGYSSCSAGHIHTVDFAVRTTADGRKIQGLVGGCFQDYFADFAGEANVLWWRGVVVKRNVQDGSYDPEFVSMDRLVKEYG
jgi:Calcineurin-like phosphoesterase